jgi:hypothetical protein
MEIKINPNLYGDLSEQSKELPWTIQIGNTVVAISYSDLMKLGLMIWDVKEQTKITPWL